MIDTLYSEVKLLRDENKKLSNYRIEAIKYKNNLQSSFKKQNTTRNYTIKQLLQVYIHIYILNLLF